MELQILNRTHALFNASIYHFLPNYPSDQYDGLFEKVCQHQRDAFAAYASFDPSYITTVRNELDPLIQQLTIRPGIIATFHLGSYRFLNLVLASARLKLALLVSTSVLGREEHHWVYQYPSLMVLDAEDPAVSLQIIRALKNEYTLVVYVDGNTGTGQGRKNNLHVPFLAGHLHVRQGFPLLAHVSNVPIYPFWHHQGGAPSAWNWRPPFMPLDGEDRWCFAQRVTEELYTLLANIVKDSPESWECWRYIHEWVVPVPISMTKDDLMRAMMEFPMKRWQVYREGDRLFCIDALNYKLFSLN
jgi:lauroyl/myristoyl acyltransferase